MEGNKKREGKKKRGGDLYPPTVPCQAADLCLVVTIERSEACDGSPF